MAADGKLDPSTGVVLLSGGSRGLGLRMVRHLLGKSVAVATFSRRRTDAMDELARTHPARFRFMEADARDYAATSRFIDAIVSDFGTLRALINNAAIGQDHLLVHAPPEMIASIIAINLEAPIMLSRLAVKRMLLQPGGGRIVSVSSICGSRGFQGLTVYSATKGAIDAFTRSLARELGERHIMVNSIAPGFFESEMSSVLAPDQLESIKRRTPSGRLTTDDQILPLLDMLLFEDTNITGQTLFIDGGITI